MNPKTVYLWGPLSSFAAPLAAWLMYQGWHVHVATKSALDLLSLSSLDLASSARGYLEKALGGRDRFRTFRDRFKLIESAEPSRDTKYDALIFCGLPPNYDEARVPRAPWTASELPKLAHVLKGVPVFLISSLWSGIQKDGVVPEELEFQRRKPLSHWERICQSYETRLLKALTTIEANWYFVRIPMIAGATTNGESFNFTGPSNLFRELDPLQKTYETPGMISNILPGRTIQLAHNPDSTFWFLPIDTVVHMFWRFLEDNHRPRICNLVSTQATLNREWLHHLAGSLGLKEIVPCSKDLLNLPSVLRKVLLDNVQVKTHNLFEAAGRYHLAPVKFDKEYFDKIVHASRQKCWGQDQAVLAPSIQFSPRLASYYFEQFIPLKFSDTLLRKVTARNTTVGFFLKDLNGSGWILKSPNGNLIVEKYERGNEKPKVSFSFSVQTMARLIQNKIPLYHALLLREIEVGGPLLDALKVAQIIDQFLKEHRLSAEQLSRFQDTKSIIAGFKA